MIGQVTKIFLSSFVDSGIQYPAGSILVKIAATASPVSSMITSIYARPTSNVLVPAINEYVILEYGPDNSTAGAYYYTDVIPTSDNINNNISDASYNRDIKQPTAIAYTNPVQPNTQNNAVADNNDLIVGTVSRIQPFIGDKLIYGRFGNTIRLGVTNKTFKQTVNTNPNWTGTNDSSPITIISNKSNSGIEDINSDNSCIILTHDQKLITFKGANSNIGKQVIALSKYNKSQVALSATRVVLNASNDFIILNSKKSTILASKNWVADMDTVMTLLDGLVSQVNSLISGLSASVASGTITTLGSTIVPIKTAVTKIKSQLLLMQNNTSNIRAIETPNIPNTNIAAIAETPYTSVTQHDLLTTTDKLPDTTNILGDLNPDGFISPMNESTYVIKSKFGPRIPPKDGASSNHGGIDFSTFGKTGIPLYAIADGIVKTSGYQNPNDSSVGYGLRMYITHASGFESLYAHLSNTTAPTGKSVKQGDIIGYSGNTGNSTGPHLHFELHKNGVKVDPLKYIPQIKTT